MSRDLNFWKYKEKISLKNNEVYAKLSDGEYVEGIQELPISNIIKSIDHVLSSWNKLDEAHYENGEEMVELFTTTQFVRFDCYQVSEEHMNMLIDVMLEYECPLYDAAIDVRFG